MAKKQDAYYFETFTACLDDACKAAQLLDRSMREFDPAQIKETLDEMHNIEHAADDKKHELLNVLAKAFITPIEREDIILLNTRSRVRSPTRSRTCCCGSTATTCRRSGRRPWSCPGW